MRERSGGGQYLGQAPGPVKIAALECCFRSLGPPRGPRFGRAGQRRCALPGGRRRQRGAFAHRQAGGGIQRGRGFVIWTGRGRGQMPGGTLGITTSKRFRQGQVRRAALSRDSGVIRDRPHQRMGEFDSGAGQADQAGGFGLAQSVGVNGAQAGRRGTHLRWRAMARSGRDEEGSPSQRAEPVQARGEALPDGVAGLQRCPGKFGAGKLLSGQSSRQLYERQGITAGLGV